jgi:hypothetical protein
MKQTFDSELEANQYKEAHQLLGRVAEPLSGGKKWGLIFPLQCHTTVHQPHAPACASEIGSAPKGQVYARTVAQALGEHLTATIPSFYWVTASGRQPPYAPNTLWPDHPSLDFHIRDTGEGLMVRVVHNDQCTPLAGEVLLVVKFSVGITHGGACIEAVAKYLRGLDVCAL